MKFRVIEAEKAFVPIARGCAALGVSESGFHAWQKRAPSAHQLQDLVLLAHIRSQFQTSYETYGSPRMTVELKEDGLQVGRHRVARLMRDNGLKALQKRRYKKTVNRRRKRTPYRRGKGTPFVRALSGEKRSPCDAQRIAAFI